MTFPTYSEEAEAYVLGGMIIDTENLEIACGMLKVSDFHFQENKEIFKEIQNLKDQGVSVDRVSLNSVFLKKKNEHSDFNYSEHILYLFLRGTSVDIKYYTKIVKDCSCNRSILELHKESLDDIKNGRSAFDVIANMKKSIESIENGLVYDDRFSIKCIAELGEDWLYATPPPKKMILEYIDEVNRTQGFMPKGNVCMVVGMGGIGKSHWVSQLAAAIATRTLFLDKFIPTNYCDGGNVFLGLAENDIDDIRRILHKATKYLRNNPEPNATEAQIKFDLENRIFPYSFHGQRCQFLKDGEPSVYYRDLKRHLIKNAPKGGWTLIILDPISRFLGAEAEKDNAAATTFIALIEELTMELPGNPTILFCHHMNKSAMAGDAGSQGASRGSSALTDGVRLQINLRGATKDDLAKYSEEEKLLKLTMMTMSKSNFTCIMEDIALKKDDDGYLSQYIKAKAPNSKKDLFN